LSVRNKAGIEANHLRQPGNWI